MSWFAYCNKKLLGAKIFLIRFDGKSCLIGKERGPLWFFSFYPPSVVAIRMHLTDLPLERAWWPRAQPRVCRARLPVHAGLASQGWPPSRQEEQGCPGRRGTLSQGLAKPPATWTAQQPRGVSRSLPFLRLPLRLRLVLRSPPLFSYRNFPHRISLTGIKFLQV